MVYYKIGDLVVNKIQEEKDLGVTIDSRPTLEFQTLWQAFPNLWQGQEYGGGGQGC